MQVQLAKEGHAHILIQNVSLSMCMYEKAGLRPFWQGIQNLFEEMGKLPKGEKPYKKAFHTKKRYLFFILVPASCTYND